MSDELLDLKEVERLLSEAHALVVNLNGTPLPSEATGTRDRNRLIAGLSRDLLFLGHLCRKSEVLTLDAYHSARGFTAHLEP